ncbi:MAG: ECF-type sigma factor [Phycisphaerales bacterium]|nr:ECF-type sigma factor [Phycisphaerales bacterium]
MPTRTHHDVLQPHREAASEDALFSSVYDQLHALAVSYMQHEPSGHTLQPTALVHEAYLKLRQQKDDAWKNPEQFLCLASAAMRQLLVDHARAKLSKKRGGAWRRITLGNTADGACTVKAEELLDIHEAVGRLGLDEPKLAQIVELRFFGGLTVRDTAKVLGLPRSTVDDEWHRARAWLHREVFGRHLP